MEVLTNTINQSQSEITSEKINLSKQLTSKSRDFDPSRHNATGVAAHSPSPEPRCRGRRRRDHREPPHLRQLRNQWRRIHMRELTSTTMTTDPDSRAKGTNLQRGEE
ncbi:hypothetical protein GW17_00047469 [Ensete ventricosum]|nr:hypothetical protein GW17_00047469 [Ensete ventricosum]